MTMPNDEQSAAARRRGVRQATVIGFITGRRTKYLVIAFWLIAVVVSAGFAGKLSGVEKNGIQSTLPSSAESTRVVDVQSSFSSPNLTPAVVVYSRASRLTEADKAKAAADVRTLGGRKDLDGPVAGPVVSADGTAEQIVVPLDLGPNSFSKVGAAVDAMRQVVQRDTNGLTVHIAGPAGDAADQSKAVSGVDGTLLLATLVVVIAILLFAYRSPVLWLLPVIAAGFSLTGAQAVIYLLAEHAGLTVSADGASILIILVFGAGTDYALLLIARYREELRRHADRHEAMAVALRRSGPAVVASAATVTISLLCLLLADMNSTKGLGPVFALGIVVGAAVMLTLFPALLVTTGRWIFWPFMPRYGTAESTGNGRWTALGSRIARRPRLTWVATLVALGVLALGVIQLNATGLSSHDAFRGHHDSVAGEEILARHFSAGAGSPVLVISNPSRAPQVQAVVAATPGVGPRSVDRPVVKGGHAFIEGTLTDPADGKAAYATIDRLRERVHAVAGADALVGGDTAMSLDAERAARHDFAMIAPVVFAVVLLILLLLLRAVVGPLVLIGTVVVSYAAALGASVLVFRHVFGFPSQDSTFPLFVFLFVVALGIDYNIFLMTRVREESSRHGTRAGTLIGLSATGGVITSAGLVLAGTFAVLATLPLTQIAELGFAVAFGILLDTFVVRSVMVTALNLDIGRHIWWPSRLTRIPDQSSLPPMRGGDAPAVDASSTLSAPRGADD